MCPVVTGSSLIALILLAITVTSGTMLIKKLHFFAGNLYRRSTSVAYYTITSSAAWTLRTDNSLSSSSRLFTVDSSHDADFNDEEQAPNDLSVSQLFSSSPQTTVEKGHAYFVATPLGNLQDITYRAVSVLRQADCIVCEDTRQTIKLLRYLHIPLNNRPLISHHEHNALASIPHILKQLNPPDGRERRSIAVVSDAGTPGISDPGSELAAALHQDNIPVHPVGCGTAVACALSVAGFHSSPFTFMGFLPVKSNSRSAALQAIAATPHVVVLYEAPHRIVQTMQQLVRECGDNRECMCGRELTKLHEQVERGTLRDILQRLVDPTDPAPSNATAGNAIRIRGEFTVVLGPLPSPRDEIKRRREKLSNGLLLDNDIIMEENSVGISEAVHRMDRISTKSRLLHRINNNVIHTIPNASGNQHGRSSNSEYQALDSNSMDWRTKAQALFAHQELNSVELDLIARLLEFRDQDKMSRSQAVKKASKALQLPRSSVYAVALKMPWS